MLWAAQDPRVEAVVTVATFVNMREAVHAFTRRFLPAFVVSDETIELAVDLAGERAAFDPSAADSLAAAASSRAPLLAIHGTSDRKLPASFSGRLVDAAPGARLELVDGCTHKSIMRSPITRHESRAWFDHHLLGGSGTTEASRGDLFRPPTPGVRLSCRLHAAPGRP